MNATAELAATNGPQSTLLIDDSSSSNTFYGHGQHLGISLFDDSIGALQSSTGATTGQLQQLINFSVSTNWGRKQRLLLI